MNKKITILACSCALLLPSFHNQMFGLESDGNANPSGMMVSVTQDKFKSDEEITTAIKNAIAADKDLSKFASDITVKTDKGVVTLSGKVDSEKVKNDLELKAKDIAGMDKVKNEIEVKTLAVY